MLLPTQRPHLVLAFIAVAAITFIYHRFQQRKKLPLPPGPPAEPLLGHLRIVPTEHPEFQYTQWGKDYNSDILHFSMLGRSIVVLNSIEAARDLLDKRGANFADRPRFVLFEVMGWGITLTFLRWSPRFKLHRKMLQQSFTQTACKAYRPVQVEEARRASRAILHDPQNWEMLLRQFSTAVVLRIGFGIEIQEKDDPYVKMAIDVEEATGEGGVPGSSLVDFFPLLRHLPSPLPKLSALLAPLTHARRTKASIQQLHDAPWDAVEPSIRSSKNLQPSFMHTHFGRYLENEASGKENAATIEDIKGAAGAISIAGGNTTWSTIIVCVLNLILHPEVQDKARAEILAAVGVDDNGDILRLPTFDDRPQLKWLEYIIQETTRWMPLSPLGVPHASIAEDTYKGYRIPAGSVVYANAWAMSRDERYYSSPDNFAPERYVPVSEGGKGEPLPDGPFGFGRRVCPGQYLALSGVYIIMATLLATMDLKCPVDEQGNEIKPTVKWSNGLSSVPDSFGCLMTPRSERSRILLEG
ncbi:putative cytochrome P450 oxidoreductase [Coniochaeta ligniaria NRRL 30616]|uniref:Putative cytochrome P450 oxidoreductase n=1 Tax=Coniochaeta ligniaria NRRL 30616 TaxID=1408157 RepID=A0A1J7IZE5_9PEZI|nr:putative cytochrome P450 oxidoreductase [Coniochaeta ligniaria NRRL 30616]